MIYPPPCAALNITGNPCCLQNSSASFAFVTALSVPGMIGTPAAIAAFLASTLSPIFFITLGEGPMKRMPLLIHACAKSALSDKKPRKQ